MARKKGVLKKEIKEEKEIVISSDDENSRFAGQSSDDELWEEISIKALDDEKEEELERLKKRIKELEKEIDNPEIEEKISEKIIEKPHGKRKEVKTLVILIIILLIVDIASVYFYYNPDLSKFKDFFKFNTGKVVEETKGNNEKCSDGTAYDSCSSKKPFYCYEGQLIKKAATCGCTAGYKVDFQDCVKT